MIEVRSRHSNRERLQQKFPEAVIVDITSRGELPMVKFSPFYPIGNIPIPYSDGHFAESVEGIWQGLKVFEQHDVDESKFTNTTMKGLKRTVRKFGVPKGHRKGVHGTELLDYITARKLIYLPAYTWVLDNALSEEIAELQAIAAKQHLILLDYETNGDIEDPKKPLSHAHLVRMRLEGLI